MSITNPAATSFSSINLPGGKACFAGQTRLKSFRIPVGMSKRNGDTTGNRLGLLIFDSTNLALKAERILKSAEIPCTVIPTPTEITVDCGIALLLHEKWVGRVTETLAASDCTGYRMLYPYDREVG